MENNKNLCVSVARNKEKEQENRDSTVSVLGLVLTEFRLECYLVGTITFHRLPFPIGGSWMSSCLLEQ